MSINSSCRDSGCADSSNKALLSTCIGDARIDFRCANAHIGLVEQPCKDAIGSESAAVRVGGTISLSKGCLLPAIHHANNERYQACVWHGRGPCEGFFDSVSPIATAGSFGRRPVASSFTPRLKTVWVVLETDLIHTRWKSNPRPKLGKL